MSTQTAGPLAVEPSLNKNFLSYSVNSKARAGLGLKYKGSPCGNPLPSEGRSQCDQATLMRNLRLV